MRRRDHAIRSLVLGAIAASALLTVPTANADQCTIASPCAFTFSATSGQNPPPQSLTINADAGLYFTTTVRQDNTVGGVQWLSVSPPTGTLGGSLGGAPTVLPNVVINSASLPAGTYTGNIVLNIGGGGGPAATLPVTLGVSGGTASGVPNPTFDRSSVALTATAGEAPASQGIVLSTGIPAPYSASASSGGGWLSVVPGAG
jgi:hypothetical protein